MKNSRIAGLLFLVAAGIFFSMGLQAPRNNTYIVLGVAFFALGLGAVRRSRPA